MTHLMESKNKILLYGASGHSKVLISIAESENMLIEGIFDDFSTHSHLGGYPIIGNYSDELLLELPLVIAIGDNNIRKKIAFSALHEFTQLIHKSTVIDETVRVGKGSVVIHNSIIQRDAIVGDHCIINSNSSIDHDCNLGDFVHISPSATLCGNVKVGDGTHIGAGATVIPNIKIGKWCVIGAGAVITKDIPDFSFVVGIPGKVIKTFNNDKN